MGGLLDGAADAYDDFAEGLSRSAQRQFDDTQGGGWFDLDTYMPGQSAGEQADVSEYTDDGIFTAPPEETGQGFAYQFIGSVPRQFDDTPDGGFADEARNVAYGAVEDGAKWATPDGANWFIDRPLMTIALVIGLVIVLSQATEAPG